MAVDFEKWQQIKEIAAKRTDDDYYINLKYVGDDNVPTEVKEANAEAIFVILSSFDKIAAVVDSAESAIRSINKVYSGVPGKLEWPEYHKLRQAIEALNESST